MDRKLNNANVATLLVLVLAIIVVIAGAVVMIVDPDTLSFEDYIKALATLGVGGGALGIGRGILAGAKQPGGFGPASDDLQTPPASAPITGIDPTEGINPEGTTLRRTP